MSIDTLILRFLSNPWSILMVVLFLGASIFIHELGHFFAARWRGLKIDRFSIGFGPKIIGWTGQDGVDYRISLLPLGGYVALPQLADMRGIEGEPSSDAKELPPLSYADKMIVAMAGAVFNMIFAFALSVLLWGIGVPTPKSNLSTQVGYVFPEQTLANGKLVEGAGFKAGLKPGDKIIKIDDIAVHDWQDIFDAVTTGTDIDVNGKPKTTFTVIREGRLMEISIQPNIVGDEKLRSIGIQAKSPLLIDSVFKYSPAEVAGLQSGDLITKINGSKCYSPIALTKAIEAKKNQPLKLTIEREGKTLETEITPETVVINTRGDTRDMVGIRWKMEYATVHTAPWKQIEDTVFTTFRVLKALLDPDSNVGLKNLSGPVGISYAIYRTSLMGFAMLLQLVVLINVNLAILNILPIPVLDGGHMAFATYQKIRGRPLPMQFIAGTQGAFMILLFSMMLYVSVFDVIRIGKNEEAIQKAEKAVVQSIVPKFTSGLPPQEKIKD